MFYLPVTPDNMYPTVLRDISPSNTNKQCFEHCNQNHTVQLNKLKRNFFRSGCFKAK